MSERPERPEPEAPPADVREALLRARRHARQAAAETLAALRALLDALALAAAGAPAEAQRALRPFARLLDGLGADLAAGAGGADSLLAAVAGALDAEIARWEARARDDADARAVLRAFLGLREILWELGVRPAPAGPAGAPGRRAARTASPPRRGGRVQRVPVQG
jgi:hypothetical protein